jgi:Ca2+-binding RTX toxin-like protein
MPVINGTSGADTLAGTSANDTINGLAGNDVINAGQGGTDVVNGGDGRDSLQFMTATSAVVVDFVAGTAGNTSFTNIEKVVTGDFNDRLTGDAAAQNLTARAGMDTLAGGGGNDTLWGGADADTFVFREMGTANADAIGDWTSGSDELVLDAAVMTALGAGGDFIAGDARFWASSTGTAHDADDRIIHNSTTRQIFYDADGNGSGAAQLIATLQSGATLVATDIAVEGGSGPAPIVGTEGNDSLVGTDGDDTIDGLGGNDTIDGGAGSDLVDGGNGDDTLRVDRSGWDDPAVDTLEGGLGDDTYELSYQIGWWSVGGFVQEGVVLNDAGGVDTIVADSGMWQLGAGFENLVLGRGGWDEGSPIGVGNELDNVITGVDDWWIGNQLDGADGNDTLIGGAGEDVFMFSAGSGNIGNDSVDGGGGEEDLLSYAGAQSAVVVDFRNGTATGGGNGGTGSVVFTDIEEAQGSSFDDLLIGNDGEWHESSESDETWFAGPRLTGAEGDDTLLGGAATDVLSGDWGFGGGSGGGDDEVRGGGGDDALISSSGSDRLFGDAGDDWLRILPADGSHHHIDGGEGIDRADYRDGGAVVADLAAGTVSVDGAPGVGSATIVGVENFVAGSYDDRLTGDAADNLLVGGDGDDTLNGGAGNDTLHGGESLGGSHGADVFLFTVAPGAANADVLAQFISGEDQIRLDASVMSELGASGTFAPNDGRFYAAAGATGGHDADDRVIYNTTTRELFYDADGSGSGEAQLLFTLQHPDTSVIASDIAVDNGGPPNPPSGAIYNGTEGDDSIIGGTGDDTVNGFGGFDTLDGGAGDDAIFGGAGQDFIRFNAAGGDYGADFVDGGADFDHLDLISAQSAVVIDLHAGTMSGGGAGGAGTATLVSIESVFGTGFGDRMVAGDGGGGFVFSSSLSGGGGHDTLIGGAARDALWGDSGNDSVLGGGGDDQLEGGGGDDWIDAGSGDDEIGLHGAPGDLHYGADTIDGGIGADRISLFPAQSGVTVNLVTGTLNGGGAGGAGTATLLNIEHVTTGDYADTIIGNGAQNYLAAFGGDDHVEGGAGNDTLMGMLGNDVLQGGDGDDYFEGGAGADTLDGGLGNDFYWVDSADVLTDAGGIDTLSTFESQDLAAGFENLNIWGTATTSTQANDAANRIQGSDGANLIDARGGNDTLIGNGGADTFVFSVAPGAANADLVQDFASASDRLVLDGNAHANSGSSGSFAAGDARFAANSTGTAQDASDRVVYNTSNGQLWYDADGSGAGARQLIATLHGVPTLVATDIEIINGSAQDQLINGTSSADTLADTAGNDTINGLAGNDSINGGHGGSDVVNGGDGRDGLQFMTATSAVVANFVSGTVTGGGSGTTSFTNIERVTTGDFNDTLTGNAAAQNLTARAGADTLAGAGGVDTLWGGAGEDVFIFRETGTANADTIGDWSSGSDEIALDNAAMGALGADGAFVAGDARFWASSTGVAHDANDRVIYNTSTRSLYYDADGNGSGAAQLIATVQAGATIAATDISVI